MRAPATLAVCRVEARLEGWRMTSFESITDQDLSAFAATLRRHGWQTADFELQEEAFDQVTPELDFGRFHAG
jgi:hypothetical protein